VLDEADRMFDRVLSAISARSSNVAPRTGRPCCSATSRLKCASGALVLKNPALVEVARNGTPTELVAQP
jgi:hypothetical protein